MSIQDLGALGQLVAAIATVATLLYLAIQIRQNNRNLQESNSASINHGFASINNRISGDAQFAEIEKAWDALKPTVAFYEGPNRPVAGSAEETIRQAGESGFVRFLAKRDGVTFVTLEPSPQEEAAFVSEKYPAEQVMLFYVLRETARLRERRKLPEAELKAAIAGLLEKASKMTGLAAFTTLEGLDAAYRRHWAAPANWWEAPQQ